jgi:RNA polymerase sigma-70 factor (ECF subfamily)
VVRESAAAALKELRDVIGEEVPEGELGSELPQHDLGIEPELAATLAQLVPRDREVLALRFGGDLNGPEIAAMTGLSPANVQQILSRSLRKLRERLEGGELDRTVPPAMRRAAR